MDTKESLPAYDGKQDYIVEARVVGGHVSSAVMGLIAGGKDAAIVANMCANTASIPTIELTSSAGA